MYCSKCGAVIPEGDQFCRSCGTPVMQILSRNNAVAPAGTAERLLFGEAKPCAHCGVRISQRGDGKVSLAGGDFLCPKCRKATLMGRVTKRAWSVFNREQIDRRIALAETFKPTINIGRGWDGPLLSIDQEHRLFCVGSATSPMFDLSEVPEKDLFDFANLMDFWPIDEIETKEGVRKGGLARAAVGGALFGGAGAIVGAMTGSERSVSKVLRATIGVGISLQGAHLSTIHQILYKYPERLTDGIEIVSIEEDVARSTVRQILEALAHIKAQNQSQWATRSAPGSEPAPMPESRSDSTSASAVSATDEIMKYKGLLDAGAITQEEYDAKKKQLLGL